MRSSRNIIKGNSGKQSDSWSPANRFSGDTAASAESRGMPSRLIIEQNLQAAPAPQGVKVDGREVGLSSLLSRTRLLRGPAAATVVQAWQIPAFAFSRFEGNEFGAESFGRMGSTSHNARQSSDELLTSARRQAKELVLHAETEADQIRNSAMEEGIANAGEKAKEILAAANAVLRETHAWQKQVILDSEPTLIKMVKEISHKLFSEGFSLDASVLERVVTRAISEASRLGDLRVYLNPVDVKILLSLWQESEITLNGQRIEMVPSQNIQRGGCFVEGQFGTVDGRVGDQLTQIQFALDEALENRDAEKKV